MAAELKLERRKAPDCKRRFVNRTDELELIQSKLNAGLNGAHMRSSVICFWGAFGMGKSWLLHNLERLYKGTSRGGAGSHPSVTVRLDLDYVRGRAFWREGRLNRELLIREMWEQLAEQLNTKVPSLDQDSPNAQAQAFVSEVTQWAASSVTPIIMLDTIDHLHDRDPESFAWFEEQVIARLAVTGRVLFCLTSRGELWHWERFQVRRRVTSCRLQPFDQVASAAQVSASPAIGEALYRETYGHPLVTDFLGTALEKEHGKVLHELEVGQVPDEVLLKRVLEHVVRQILDSLPEATEKLARHACVLRWLAVEPLRALAETLEIEERGRGESHYDDLLYELQEHDLVYWNGTTKAYEFDPVLRKLLARCLQLESPEQFCAAHDAAYTFHRDHLRDRPAYLHQYVPELAYHRTLLGRFCPSTPRTGLREWWQAFLSEGRPQTEEPWQELVKSLADDSELESELPPGEYKLLCETTQRRANPAPTKP